MVDDVKLREKYRVTFKSVVRRIQKEGVGKDDQITVSGWMPIRENISLR